MKGPPLPPAAPSDPSEEPNDLLKFSELLSAANEPAAPEADGDLAELQSWDEPIDERGHRVSAASEDDPTLGEDLVQQGVDEADTEVRKWARQIPDAP
jgi:hypothetical protein